MTENIAPPHPPRESDSKTILWLWFALLLTVAGCAPFGRTSCVTYKSNAGGFSVDVPRAYRDFKTASENKPSPRGRLKVITYTSLSRDAGFSITVLDLNLPAEFLTPGRLEQILSEGRKSAMRHGRVISTGKTTIAGATALSMRNRIESESKPLYVESLYTILGGRLYQISVVSPRLKFLDAEPAKRFFKSFTYMGKQ